MIYDLQRGRQLKLDKIVFEIFKDINHTTVEDLISQNPTYEEGIMAYIDFFVKNDLGWFIDDVSQFPEMEIVWDNPNALMNAIVELDDNFSGKLKFILNKLRDANCVDVQLRLLNNNALNDFLENLRFCNESDFRSVEIFISEEIQLKEEHINKIIFELDSLTFIYVFGGKINFPVNQNKVEIKPIPIAKSYDENYDLNQMRVNVDIFMEAQFFNIGLNRKLCIDRNGDICNYFTHEKRFGNIADVDILDILKLDEFLWQGSINNNDIDKCKNCIYRYCCLSNTEVYKENGTFFKKQYCDLPFEEI